LETAISWKFRDGAEYYRHLEISLAVAKPWNVICIAIVVVAAAYYLHLRFKRNRITKYGDSPWEIEARNLDNFESKDSNPEKKKIKGKGQTASFQQARNESHEEKSCLVNDNKKGKKIK